MRIFNDSNLKVRYLVHEDSRFTQHHTDARGCDGPTTLGVYLPRPHMLIIKSFDECTIVHELWHSIDHLLSDELGVFWSDKQDDWKALYEKHAPPNGDGRVVGDGYATQSVVEYIAENVAAALGFPERQQPRLQRMCPETYRNVYDIIEAIEIGWLEPRLDHNVSRCQSAGIGTNDNTVTASHTTTQAKDDDAHSSTPLQETEASGS